MIFTGNLLAKINLTGNRAKVIKNVYWAIIGKVVNILSSLIVGVLIARYLGPNDFGIFNYIISYVTLFAIIASFGLDNIEIKELAGNPNDKSIILGSSIVIRFVFATLAFIVIIISVLIYESDYNTKFLISIYALSVFFSPFNVIKNYFSSIVLNKFIIKSEIIRTIISMVFKGVLLLIHAPLMWFIIAMTFDFLFLSIGYFVSYQTVIKDFVDWKFDLSKSKFLIKESFPLLLSGASIIIYQKIDQVMIRNMIDNHALGQFSVAAKLSELVIFIPVVIAQSISPILVKQYREDKIKYVIKSQVFMDYMIWIAIIISLVVSLLSSYLIPLLFGSEYSEAVLALKIMAWKAMGVSLSIASGQLIIIEGIQKFAVIRNLIGTIACVVMNLMLIPWLGIIGSAITSVVTVIFTGLLSHALIPKYRHLLSIQIKALLFGWQSIIKIIVK